MVKGGWVVFLAIERFVLCLGEIMKKWVFLLLLGVSPAFAELGDWDDPFPEHYFSGRAPAGRDQIVSLELNPQGMLNSSFRLAVREGRFTDIQILLKQGAGVNSSSSRGETALMFASRNCSPKTIQFLVDNGASINQKDQKGRTALIYAARESCVPAIFLLLKTQTVDVQARDEFKKSALDYANENSLLEVAGPSQKIIHMLRSGKRKT